MLWLFLAFVVLFLTWDSNYVEPDPVVVQMQTDGLSAEKIRRYVALDKHLKELEKVSVETGVSHLGKAQQVSMIIKEEFPGYNFKFHALTLKNISTPLKQVRHRLD